MRNGRVEDKLVNGSKALSYTYTASGKVASITDKSGKKTTYQNDKAEILLKGFNHTKGESDRGKCTCFGPLRKREIPVIREKYINKEKKNKLI